MSDERTGTLVSHSPWPSCWLHHLPFAPSTSNLWYPSPPLAPAGPPAPSCGPGNLLSPVAHEAWSSRTNEAAFTRTLTIWPHTRGPVIRESGSVRAGTKMEWRMGDLLPMAGPTPSVTREARRAWGQRELGRSGEGATSRHAARAPRRLPDDSFSHPAPPSPTCLPLAPKLLLSRLVPGGRETGETQGAEACETRFARACPDLRGAGDRGSGTGRRRCRRRRGSA